MFLEVRHLRLIDAITRQGSVTKAGSVLFLSQSALSHQLMRMFGAPPSAIRELLGWEWLLDAWLSRWSQRSAVHA